MADLWCPYCHAYAGRIRADGEFWCPECGRAAQIDYGAVVADYGTAKAKRRWERQGREREETKQMTLALGLEG